MVNKEFLKNVKINDGYHFYKKDGSCCVTGAVLYAMSYYDKDKETIIEAIKKLETEFPEFSKAVRDLSNSLMRNTLKESKTSPKGCTVSEGNVLSSEQAKEKMIELVDRYFPEE